MEYPSQYTPEELEQFVNEFKQISSPEATSAIDAAKEEAELLRRTASGAPQKIGSIANQNDNLRRLMDIKSQLPTTNPKDFVLVPPKDFTMVGEPITGGLPAPIPDPRIRNIPTPEGGLRVNINQSMVPAQIPEGGLRVPTNQALISAEKNALVPFEQQAAKSGLKMGLGRMGKLLAKGLPIVGPVLTLADYASPSDLDENRTASKLPEFFGPPSPPPPQTMLAGTPEPQQEVPIQPEPSPLMKKGEEENPNAFASRLMAILNSHSRKSIPLNIQGTDIGSDAAMIDAQNRESKAALINRLGQSAELFGSSIARVDPIAQDIFKDNIKRSENITKNLKDRIENQKNDPNSAISKAYKAEVERITGSPIQGNPSAAALEKITPLINQQMIHEDSSKDKLATAMMYAQQRKDDKDRLRDQFAMSQLSTYQDKAAKETAKLRTQLEASEGVVEMSDLAIKNGTAGAALGTMVAKARGEVGALTENDVTRYIQNKQLTNRIANWFNQNAIDGTILPVNAEMIKEIERVVQGRLKDNITKAYNRVATAYSRNTGMDFDRARLLVRTDDAPPEDSKSSGQSKQKSASTKNTQPTDIHKDGEIKTLNDGRKVRWDGKGWAVTK